MPTESQTLVLDWAPTLDRLETIRGAIAERLGDEALSIETSELTEAPLSLVQLLYAAHLSAEARRAALSIACPAEGALLSALSAFGFLNAERGAPRIEGGHWTGLDPR